LRPAPVIALTATATPMLACRGTTFDSNLVIRQALDRALTFLDNSWDYNDGQSELRMGAALRDGYRKKVFSMTRYRALAGQRNGRAFPELF